ncbi:hypothetical protein ACHAWF_007173, partial [Thalassiosira exigua]
SAGGGGAPGVGGGSLRPRVARRLAPGEVGRRGEEGGGGDRRGGDGEGAGDGEDDEEGEEAEATLVCSSERTRAAAHPRWDHVNEMLPDPERLGECVARFVVSVDDGAAGGEKRVVGEVPLDPSRLRRLPAGDGAWGGDGRGGSGMTVPRSLPPNAVLIHYEDGYTRVLPELHRLLVRRGIVSEGATVDPVARDDDGRSRSDVGEEDGGEDALGGRGTTRDEGRRGREEARAMRATAPRDCRRGERAAAEQSEEKEPDLVSEAALEAASDQTVDNGKEELARLSPPPTPPLAPLPPPAELYPADDAFLIGGDVEELRRLVQMEQRLLEEERRLIAQVYSPAAMHRTHLFRADFRLEAHRIRLLRHLRLIFPIRLVPVNITAHPPHLPQHHYTIAGVPLPDDVHGPAVADDRVSTALGFLCHLVALTSKYLAIPLRFPVVCKFSRSAVLSERGREVYPLFRERGVVDREQLDQGLMLLGLNIDCLLGMRRVEFSPEWNALAKMDKLLTQVIEGEDLSFGVD